MILLYTVFCGVGELLMYLARKFPPIRKIAEKIKFDLDCNLCLGFWTYLVLSVIFRIDVMDGLENYDYLPVFSEMVTAAFTSFVMHLFVIGWKDLFSIYEVKS